MIKYSQIIFSILLVIFIASCSSSGDKRIKSFPQSISIKGEVCKSISFYTSSSVNMIVVDTFLVAQKKDESLLHIYSTNTHSLLGKVGKIGYGPKEFQFPDVVKQFHYDQENNSPVITMYDVARRRFSQINLFKALENAKGDIKQEPVYEINDYLTYLFHRDDSIMVATPEIGGRLLLYNYTKEEKIFIPYVPEIELVEFKKSEVYRSAVAVNLEERKIVAAPAMLNELNFFDFNGNLIGSSLLDSRDKITKKFQRLNKGRFDDSVRLYIYAIEQTDDAIIALNIDNELQKLGKIEKREPMKFQFFDWDGNAIKEYTLDDKRNISAFTYDKIHNRIYAYSHEEKDFNIVMYDLNKSE